MSSGSILKRTVTVSSDTDTQRGSICWITRVILKTEDEWHMDSGMGWDS